MFLVLLVRTSSAQDLSPLPEVLFDIPGETLPVALAAADFDGNGALDVAWTEGISRRVSIAHATTPGVFGAPIILDPGAELVTGGWLAAGDIDGDGFGDLFTSTSTAGASVAGWAGGPGGLLGPTWQLAGNDPIAFLGDVDGSGLPDLAIGLDVWLGAVGGPTPGLSLPGGLVYPYSAPFPVGDVDGDGSVDLYVPDHAASGAYFDGMDGPATLATYGGVPLWAIDLELGTGALAVVADLDGDGDGELVSVDASRSDDAFWGGITALADLANAAPTRLTTTALELDVGQGLTLAALDDDDADGDQSVLLGHDGVIRELGWDPALGFDLTGPARTWGHGSRTVHATLTVDLDGDGLRDLVAAFSQGESGPAGSEIAIWLTGASAVPTGPTDTGGGDTGTVPEAEIDDEDEPAAPAEPAAEPAAEGCAEGCATGARAPLWLAALALAAVRRHRGRGSEAAWTS